MYNPACTCAILAVCQALGALTGLRSLALPGNNMDCREADALRPALGQLTGLQDLDLRHNSLGDALDGGALGLSRLTQLTRLNLAHNCLWGIDTGTGEQLGHLTRLQALDLSYNELLEPDPSLDGQCAFTLVGRLPWLTYLNLAGLQLQSTVIDEVCTTLAQLTGLQVLDLSCNCFCQHDYTEIARVLTVLTALHTLRIDPPESAPDRNVSLQFLRDMGAWLGDRELECYDLDEE